MKLLKFIVYVLYKAWNRGRNKSIAYESAIVTLVFFLWLDASATAKLFGVTDILPFYANASKSLQYFTIAVFLTPMYLILTYIFKKEEIMGLVYDIAKLKNGFIALAVLGIVSILFFIISSEMNYSFHRVIMKQQ